MYLGSSVEYLIQLKLLRPIFETNYPGIEIFICCQDNCNVLDGEEKVIKYSELKSMRNMFAYVREITYKENKHPIEELLKECQIPDYRIPTSKKNETTLCAVYPNGNYPTKSLTSDQVKKLYTFATDKGYRIAMENENPDEVDWAIGVENKEIFTAAAEGIKTTLIITGLGGNLFKCMFPNGEILLPAHI